jgi:hypothetical protein
MGCEQGDSNRAAEEARLAQEADRVADSDVVADVHPGPAEIDDLDDERSVERRIADATLSAKARLALVETESLRPFDFEAVVINGRVLLRGEVRTQDQRSQAQSIVEGVDGVRDVINEVSATEEPMATRSERAQDSVLAAMEDAAQAAETVRADASVTEDAPSSQTSESSTSLAESSSEETAVYHAVRSGDSLWEIARRYSVSVEQITRLNNLQSNRLMPGQRLRIQ